MNNVPVIKIGIVAVSRDCFPESLAVNRRKATRCAFTWATSVLRFLRP